MKIVVLGATGMLGCYSSLALKARGHHVVAVGRRISDSGFFAKHGILFVGGVKLEDESCFSSLPVDVDAVVHMAGTMPAHADASPMPYVQSIVVGMVNVLEWMKSTSARRIVFNTTPSDVSSFFGKPIPVPDDAPRSFPKDGGDHAVYAICKNAAVDILEHYRIAYGFKPIVFRHLTVYGWSPNASYSVNGTKKILPWRQIVRRAIAGEPIEVWGDPGKKKELLYIDDFTDAVIKAVESGICGLFNLPGPRPYTLEEQIDGIIEGFSPQEHPASKIYLPDRPSSPENLLLGDRVRNELGWSAVTTWTMACEKMRNESQDNRFVELWGQTDLADRC